MRDMEKAYSFRFYPTPEQESLLRRTLGCVRLVYNKALHLRTQAWYERQERVVSWEIELRLLTMTDFFLNRQKHQRDPMHYPLACR